MELKFAKRIEKTDKNIKNAKLIRAWKKNDIGTKMRSILKPDTGVTSSTKSYFLVFALFFCVFAVLFLELSSLQIAQGSEMLAKSENNQVRVESIAANRGVLFDRNGTKLVENIASSKLYVMINKYLDEKGDLDDTLLQQTADTLVGILGDHWQKVSEDKITEYSSIMERITKIHEASPYFTDILIATDLSNDEAIKIKADASNLPGVYIDEGSKRSYPYKNVLSAILGYTGDVTAEDLDNLDYVNATDTVGRTGLEREYNKNLAGQDGEIAWEVDILGKKISEEGLMLKAPVAGDNLYLSLDIDVQNKLYQAIEAGVKNAKATGGAGIIQDVNTGEILAIVTYPSYDNNLFIGGISTRDYSALLGDKANPLLNRAIAAQVPAGSTFKTMVATGALDSGAITKYTQYVSRAGYTFSSGAPFQEYHNHSYGTLNVVEALMVSSNIFFCETIRHWDMNALVPYLEKFGIGQTTGVDIPGEMAGRVPSPANKIALANSTSPWLDPIWYPEGDSCNSVIGQGITLVTPIQMSNWMAAIANGGTLYKPHVAKYFVDAEGNKTEVSTETLQTNIAGNEALSIVRTGMRAAVSGNRASVSQLANVGVNVAAKTGTAEFGALNKDGSYEHTHAWVGGFFPFENPKYSFSLFLEDGGESYNASNVMKEVISWMVQAGKI